MCLQEKLQSFILDLNKFKFSHPIIFGKWLSYISEQTTNYTLLDDFLYFCRALRTRVIF